MKKHNQFKLLTERRFLAYFISQFLSAFNDNFFKSAVLVLIAISFSQSQPTKANLLVNLSSVAIMIPFFLFSATAGQLADKFHKSTLMCYIKFLEIIIVILGALVLYWHNIYASIIILFLMGTHSAFLGPIKYSILPQQLHPHELTGANGLVEMSTFLAIILGIILGSFFMNSNHFGDLIIPISTISIAVIAWISSLFVPQSEAHFVEKNLKINWNPIKESYSTLKMAYKKPKLFLAILGISWFWFYGSLIIAQFPNYSVIYLQANSEVISLLLVFFALGIGLGSLACDKLSNHQAVELGLIPMGMLGLSLFSLDFSFAHPNIEHLPTTLFSGVVTVITTPIYWRVLIDLFFLGFFSGLYLVPLYVLLQSQGNPKKRSRIIAAANIMSALFMVIAPLFAIILFSLKLSIPQVFFIVALMNIAILVYICQLIPHYFVRFLAFLIIPLFYKMKINGQEHLPKKGPYVLVCNHVSFIDWLFILSSVSRPVHFVIYHRYYNQPIVKNIFRKMQYISISSEKENQALKTAAFEGIARTLQAGNIVVLFPEGCVTKTGDLQQFRWGIEQIIRDTPVPVIPMALEGLWGSFFSHKNGKAMRHFPRRWLRFTVNLFIGEPISAEHFNCLTLEETVRTLQGTPTPECKT